MIFEGSQHQQIIYTKSPVRGTQKGHCFKTRGHKRDIEILKGDLKGTYAKKRGRKGDI